MEIKKKGENMKNPNGYGSVVRLSGNRRRPFCARKTTGWNEKGYPIYKPIGYYVTREEAMIALAEYNRNPYDIDLSKITFKELYEKWSARDFPKMKKTTASCHRSAFRHTEPLYNTPYKNIKAYQMQEIIDGCGRGYSTQGSIKNLFGQLDRFALELDIITKCNSNLVSAAPIPPSEKKPFTEDEIKKVWKIADQEWVDSVLFFLYTGFRISEVIGIKAEDVDFEQLTIKGGIKTAAGKNRIVPIHPRIEKYVRARVAEGNKYLFSYKNKKLSASQYYSIWSEIMDQLQMHHTPHECRHTFRSRLDSANANKKCIDLLMGHASKDVGERVYTHKTLDELRETINLLL